MSGYAPFDQDKHLGEPPWSPDDPALQAWEAGHGHDVRLDCDVDYGCQAIENELERLEATIAAVRALCQTHFYSIPVVTLLRILDGGDQ